MRKLKYILTSVVLATAFASCETETIDEKLKDETLEAKPILRFELNDKQTIVTDKVHIEKTDNSDSFRIVAKLSIENLEESDDATRYKLAFLRINFSTLSIGSFPTYLSLDNPSNLTSSASLEITGEGTYSTANAKENQPTGYANITFLSPSANYIDGNFEYILYPAQGSNLQPQRLTNGNFMYVKH